MLLSLFQMEFNINVKIHLYLDILKHLFIDLFILESQKQLSLALSVCALHALDFCIKIFMELKPGAVEKSNKPKKKQGKKKLQIPLNPTLYTFVCIERAFLHQSKLFLNKLRNSYVNIDFIFSVFFSSSPAANYRALDNCLSVERQSTSILEIL